MRNQNLECKGKDHTDGQQTSSQQPEMSNHRHRSRSSNNDSSNSRGHSSSGPSQAVAARSVRFAETSLHQAVIRHEDRDDVGLQDLWYSRADLKLMTLAILREVHDQME